jgi:hypothetical protein
LTRTLIRSGQHLVVTGAVARTADSVWFYQKDLALPDQDIRVPDHHRIGGINVCASMVSSDPGVEVLDGPGRVRELIRAIDWSANPLGPVLVAGVTDDDAGLPGVEFPDGDSLGSAAGRAVQRRVSGFCSAGNTRRPWAASRRTPGRRRGTWSAAGSMR